MTDIEANRDDYLRAEQVLVADDLHDVGTTYEIAGLGVVLVEGGLWRIFESLEDIEEAHENERNEGWIECINPDKFPTASSLYQYIVRVAIWADNRDDQNDGGSVPGPDFDSPGVH